MAAEGSSGGGPSSTGYGEIRSLRPLAFLVGLNIEADALAFVQSLQACALHRGDVHKHVASAIVRLDEAIAAFAIEKFDRTGHCHRETPPHGCSAVGPHGSKPRLDIHDGPSAAKPALGTRRPPKELERLSPAEH